MAETGVRWCVRPRRSDRPRTVPSAGRRRPWTLGLFHMPFLQVACGASQSRTMRWPATSRSRTPSGPRRPRVGQGSPGLAHEPFSARGPRCRGREPGWPPVLRRAGSPHRLWQRRLRPDLRRRCVERGSFRRWPGRISPRWSPGSA